MPISKKPYPIERILAAGTYLTAGGVGFVWLIIAALSKKTVTKFLMYHIMQSIFISIAFFLISILGNLIYVILYKIPLINAIPYLINMPLSLVFNLSLVQLFTTSIILYLAITSGLGYYSYLPWFSDIIKDNTGV
ncbi:MAG: hypothetical protein E7Z92_02830 [Cyanobacteria bacterium SIG31]|nr:hypothetical protein [Cyanobacteria bacterium SIG31]